MDRHNIKSCFNEVAASEKSKLLKFISSPREPGEYFSHQRNRGIAAANSEWLLHMDIDERVGPEFAREILAAIHRGDRQAFRFRRLNHFLNRPMSGGGWQSWNQIHLAQREVLHFGGMFHEECLLTPEDIPVGQLREKMLHLNERSYSERLGKSDTYLEEVTYKISKSGKRAGALQLLGVPLIEFVKKYIFKFGFRDGTPGLISAIHSASARFRALALVWDAQNPADRSQLEARLEQEWQKVSLNVDKQSDDIR